MLDETAIYTERQFGAINWLGFWTLYEKEVRRFVKVYTQTLLAPMITALLYLVVFMLALGGSNRMVGLIPYAVFLAPGLTMMTMSQNAFANTSSSIVISKVQGNIIDLLMPPLSATEVVFAIALGGATRGMVVGLAVLLAVVPFVPIHVYDWGAVLYHGFAASLMLSLVGIIGGLWSEKFDHIAAVTNFIVIPLSFLSGTFYSVSALPKTWQVLAHFDPFFYMIDGFRYGFIGRSDSPLWIGFVVMAALNAFLLSSFLAPLPSGL